MSELSLAHVFFLSLRISLFVALLLPTSFMVIRALDADYFERWTMKKELAWTLGHLLIIALNNWILIQNIPALDHLGLMQVIYTTALVGAIPIGVDIRLRWNAGSADQAILSINDIVYVRSDGNYLHVFRETEEGFDRELVRSTLKQFCARHDQLIQVHKQYLVNCKRIDRATGNSNGGVIRIGEQHEVPYSRSYFQVVKSMNIKVT